MPSFTTCCWPKRRSRLFRLAVEGTMKLPRRQVLHLAVGAAALPDVSPVAKAQAYPSRPVRINGQRLARGWTELPGDQRDRLCTRWRGGHRRRGRNNLGIEKYETSFRGTRRFIPAIPGGSLVHVRGKLIGINTAFLGAGKTAPAMVWPFQSTWSAPCRSGHRNRRSASR